MVISAKLYHEIVRSFGPVPPENGGIIGCVGNEVCAFCLDHAHMIMERNCYIPNAAFLSEVATKWSACGISFAGIVHTHPSNQRELSSSDRQYVCEVMGALRRDCESLYFPLVFPGEEIVSYIAYHGSNEIIIEPDEITII